MDFSLTDEQEATRDLARQILGDRASHERQREIEHDSGARHDADLWATLADAGLLGLAIPEEYGGAGLGIGEVGALLEESGRVAAPVPLLATLGLSVPAIVEFGSDELRAATLPSVVDGSTVLTAALSDELVPVTDPTTEATPDGDDWRLTGAKICVPAGMLADQILVSGVSNGVPIVGLVDADAQGLHRTSLVTTADSPDARVELDGVVLERSALLGADDPGAVLPWLIQRATALQCVTMAGVCQAALALTASYITERKQFDVPIATFQAVGQRAADAYIDTEAIRLTAWQAVWRLENGLEAEQEVASAKFWAAEAGQRVVHSGVHLHGGVGVDRDYPLARLFLAAKELELQLGGATAQLRALGRSIAARA